MSVEARPAKPCGPGSLEIPITVDLLALRNQLSRVDHPLGCVPQWNGESLFIVHCEYAKRNVTLDRLLLISSKSESNAKDVAIANIKSRDLPDWNVVLCHKVDFISNKQLQANIGIDGGQ